MTYNDYNITTQNMFKRKIPTFLRFGNFGKPLRVVSPTLIRLNDSRFVNWSVSPSIQVDLQLSKFNSTIYNKSFHLMTVR